MAGSGREQALCALVETLFAANANVEEQCPSIFAALRNVLDFSSAVFMPIDPIDWTLRPGDTHDAPHFTAEYLAHYQRLDPYVIEAICLKSFATPVRLSDIADIVRVAQGEFGLFLRQVPYFHALASAPLLQGCPLGMASIHRRREQPDFNDQEIELFGWFVRQWARAVDHARLRGRLDHSPFYGDFDKTIHFNKFSPPPIRTNRDFRRGAPDPGR